METRCIQNRSYRINLASRRTSLNYIFRTQNGNNLWTTPKKINNLRPVLLPIYVDTDEHYTLPSFWWESREIVDYCEYWAFYIHHQFMIYEKIVMVVHFNDTNLFHYQPRSIDIKYVNTFNNKERYAGFLLLTLST